ncbi:radical SAM protein [Nonomuraea deserti]|uniref:radical SAM protein n=1 Tax=Nonomuraea deserti TaxID=1848322 RepID=UPI002482A64B|nr:radical SAM protein [Nonomuraea deserti]
MCQFILKLHSRCDLSCDYCYVYEMADQSWKSQPRRASKSVIAQAASRIAEHAHAHRMPSVHVILHGGEPLLAGPDHIAHTVQAVRKALGPAVRLDVSLQTNAMRLDEAYLRLFDELNVRVGVSLDGDAEGHDRHRRRADGRGSHATVTAALGLLGGRYRHLFGGLLCTVDARNDPIATSEALLESRPPRIDFLLPHGNWAEPPPGLPAGDGGTPYADWLIPNFDRWYAAPRRETEVRLFDDIMRLLMDELQSAVGRVPNDLTVRVELAMTVWHAGDPRAALPILHGVLAADGDTPVALQARGEILADLGRPAQALRDLDRVRQPEEPATIAARALALAELDRAEEAAAELEVALVAGRDQGLVAYLCARALSRMGDRERAAQVARDASRPPLTSYQRRVLADLG